LSAVGDDFFNQCQTKSKYIGISNNCVDFTLRRILQDSILAEILVFLFSFFVGMIGVSLPLVWDDWIGLSYARLSIKSPATFVDELTSTPRVGWYLPIARLFDLARYYFFGYDPIPSHVAKAVLLAFSAILLFRTMRLITGQLAPPLLSSVFYSSSFGVTFAVWWSGNLEVVAQLFVMLALYSFISYLRSKSSTWLTIMCLSSILAPLAKTTGIVAVATIGLYLPYLLAYHRKDIDVSLIVAYALSAFFAVFPNFIPNLFLKRVIVFSALGSTYRSEVLAFDSVLGNVLHHSSYLAAQVPMALQLLCIASCAYGLNTRKGRFLSVAAITGYVALVFASFKSYPTAVVSMTSGIWIITSLVITLTSRREGKLFGCWFLGAFLPLLSFSAPRIDHVAPALVPLIALTFLQLENWKSLLRAFCVRLFNMLSSLVAGGRRALRPASVTEKGGPLFLVVLIIGYSTTINLANLWNTYVIWGDLWLSLDEIQVYVRDGVPEGAVLLWQSSNGMGLVDLYNLTGRVMVMDLPVDAQIEPILNNSSWVERGVYVVADEGNMLSLARYVQAHRNLFTLLRIMRHEKTLLFLEPTRLIFGNCFGMTVRFYAIYKYVPASGSE